MIPVKEVFITTGKYDPRNPAKEVMVKTDSDHPFHAAIPKIYILLSLETVSGKVFFIINGLSSYDNYKELQEDQRYLYEEHTCPTNFINIPMICLNGDADDHGIFEFEEAIWQVGDFDNNDEYFLEVFPQLTQERAKDKIMTSVDEDEFTEIIRDECRLEYCNCGDLSDFVSCLKSENDHEDIMHVMQKYIDSKSIDLSIKRLYQALSGDDKELQKFFGGSFPPMPQFNLDSCSDKGWCLLNKMIEANPEFFVNAKISQQAKEIESLVKENRNINACIDRMRPRERL